MNKQYKIVFAIVGFLIVVLVSYMAAADDRELAPTRQVECTMEAKLCPDGSYVGRSGPLCQFEACPEVGGF